MCGNFRKHSSLIGPLKCLSLEQVLQGGPTSTFHHGPACRGSGWLRGTEVEMFGGYIVEILTLKSWSSCPFPLHAPLIMPSERGWVCTVIRPEPLWPRSRPNQNGKQCKIIECGLYTVYNPELKSARGGAGVQTPTPGWKDTVRGRSCLS